MQRGGVVRYSLMVHEPGIDGRSRRLLWWWRAWPWLGAAGLVALLVATALVLPAPAVLVIGGVAYGAGFACLAMLTRPERRRTRRLWAVEPSEPASAEEWLACARLKCLGNLMVEADEALAAGRITPVDHALVWSRVYSDLSVGQPATLPTLHPHGHR